MTNSERKSTFKRLNREFRERIDEHIEQGSSLQTMYEEIAYMCGVINYAQCIGVITHKEAIAYIDDIYSYRKVERLNAN